MTICLLFVINIEKGMRGDLLKLLKKEWFTKA